MTQCLYIFPMSAHVDELHLVKRNRCNKTPQVHGAHRRCHKKSFQSVSSASFSCLQHRAFQRIFPIEWFRRQFAHLKWFINRDFVIHLSLWGDALHRNLLVDHNGICWFRWITYVAQAREGAVRPRGGYSLYIGWYGSAAVLIPLLTFWGWNTIFLEYFYSSPTPKRSFGILKNYQSLKNSIFFAQNSTFPSIFWGPTFSNQRHIHPHRFSDPSISMVWHILFSKEMIIVMTELNRHIDCIKEYKNHNETHACIN